MKKFLMVLALLCCVQSNADAGFEIYFNPGANSVMVGQTVAVDVVLRETAGTSYFGQQLAGFAFSYNNSNAGSASVIGFVPNPLITTGSGSIGASSGDFTYATFGVGATGSDRTLGTFTFQGNSVGTTSIQLGLSPAAFASELVFGNFPIFTAVDLDTAGIPVIWGQGNISVTAVPEPTSLALVGLAGVGSLCNRRVRGMVRRKKQTV